MAAVTVASVATAVEWPAAAADCSCVVTAFMGTVPAAACVSDLPVTQTQVLSALHWKGNTSRANNVMHPKS